MTNRVLQQSLRRLAKPRLDVEFVAPQPEVRPGERLAIGAVKAPEVATLTAWDGFPRSVR